MQRDHGGGSVGMSDAEDCVPDPDGLYQRSRRGGRRSGPAPAVALRVLTAGVSRDGRCSGILLSETE